MKKLITLLVLAGALTLGGCSLAEEKPVVTDIFTAIEDYQYFFMNYADSDLENKVELKTEKPEDVVYIKDLTDEDLRRFGSQHVWGKEGWNTKPAEEMQLFFFQTMNPSEPGSETMTEQWYGPFQGKLGLLVK